MVIDRGKLIALLVDKTGRSKPEIEEQLDELTRNIKEKVKSGDTFEIPGFGTFLRKDGELQFEPHKQLQTEINQKYAGMKPIELMAAFKETGAGVPVEEVSPEPPKKKKPVKEKPVRPKKKKKKKPASPPKKKKPAMAAAPPSPKKKTVAKSPEKKEKTPPKKRMRREEKEAYEKVLVAVVVGIAVLVGGWMLYDSWVLSTSGGSNKRAVVSEDTTAQNQTEEKPAAIDDSVTAVNTAEDSAEQNGNNAVSENRAAGQEFSSTIYGLKGQRNPEGNNGYTIVVHSFRLRTTVQEIADSLSQQGYRTVLFEGSPDGTVRWRLGIGQFETIAKAQQAVQRLSEPYKENHFIKRIQ